MAINITKNLNIGEPSAVKFPRNFVLEIILLAAVCILFYWFIILPKNSQLTVKNSQLSQAKDEQTQISNTQQTISNLITQLHASPQQVGHLDEAIPLEGNSRQLQVLIQSLADSAGVTLGNASFSTDSSAVVAGDTKLLSDPYGQTRTLDKLTGTIYVTGTFSQVDAFLQKVETSGRLLQVNSLGLQADPDNSLGLKLGVDTYYLGVSD